MKKKMCMGGEEKEYRTEVDELLDRRGIVERENTQNRPILGGDWSERHKSGEYANEEVLLQWTIFITQSICDITIYIFLNGRISRNEARANYRKHNYT